MRSWKLRPTEARGKRNLPDVMVVDVGPSERLLVLVEVAARAWAWAISEARRAAFGCVMGEKHVGGRIEWGSRAVDRLALSRE